MADESERWCECLPAEFRQTAAAMFSICRRGFRVAAPNYDLKGPLSQGNNHTENKPQSSKLGCVESGGRDAGGGRTTDFHGLTFLYLQFVHPTSHVALGSVLPALLPAHRTSTSPSPSPSESAATLTSSLNALCLHHGLLTSKSPHLPHSSSSWSLCSFSSMFGGLETHFLPMVSLHNRHGLSYA